MNINRMAQFVRFIWQLLLQVIGIAVCATVIALCLWIGHVALYDLNCDLIGDPGVQGGRQQKHNQVSHTRTFYAAASAATASKDAG
jgi:hypothetical protein